MGFIEREELMGLCEELYIQYFLNKEALELVVKNEVLDAISIILEFSQKKNLGIHKGDGQLELKRGDRSIKFGVEVCRENYTYIKLIKTVYKGTSRMYSCTESIDYDIVDGNVTIKSPLKEKIIQSTFDYLSRD
ncbi:MAG: hypothetical protein QXD03_04540 [Candidatus Anstonellales archaeon]